MSRHPRNDPLAGSQASDRGFGMIVILAGRHGDALTAWFGLPHNVLLSKMSRRK
jgi:hypothetical protein